MKPKFLSSTDCNKKCKTYSKSDSSIVMIGNGTDEIIQKPFDLIFHKCQIGLAQSIKGSNFIFDCVLGTHHLCNKISTNHCQKFIDFPKWIKKGKTTINPKNNVDNCFQYTMAIALNHKQIKGEALRMTKICPFINQDEWKDFPSHKKDWKKSETSNKSMTLHVGSFHTQNKEIRHTC